MERLVERDDERGHDDHEDVFLDGNPEDVHARPELDGEHADGERVPVPDVRQRVERGDGDAGTTQGVRTVEERERQRAERHFRRQVGVRPEDRADVRDASGEHATGYEPRH